MNDRSRNYRNLGISEWPWRVASRVGVIAREIHAELKRFNHGGDYCIAARSPSRHDQIRAFKEFLVQRYQHHNRCC
jgi:hypothetical protein